MWVLTLPKQGSERKRANVTKVHEQAFSAFLPPGPGRSLTHRGTGTLKSAPQVPILHSEPLEAIQRSQQEDGCVLVSREDAKNWAAPCIWDILKLHKSKMP